MASNLNTNPQIFRDGTSQRNRSLKALEPDYIAVDERSVRDWLKFVREFAKELKYYDEFNNPTGDWSPFFNLDIDKIIAYLDRPELFADNETELKQLSQPHLVLFLTFLQLLRYPQQQFKQLTRRYLDFYYKEVLRLKAKEEEPDRVNIIFELASDVEEDLLPKGTLLAAGQDSQGVDINYATDRDIVINQAQVASVKTLYIDEIQNFHAASIVEAKGGEAAKLPELGFNSFKTIPQTEEILVKNSVGFAITSPLLLLREGTREIRLTLACQENSFDRDRLNQIASRSILPFDIY